MPARKLLRLSKSSPIFAIIFSITVINSMTNSANALTGEEILTKLDSKSQVDYVSGVLQGLGYARFLKDKPDQSGIRCIQTWLLEDGIARWQIVKQWLEHHKEKPAGVIIYAMVSKDCGR